MKTNNRKQVTAKEKEERKKQREIVSTSNKANAEANTAADAIAEGRAELPELWSSNGRKPPENALLLGVPPGGVHGFGFLEARPYKGSIELTRCTHRGRGRVILKANYGMVFLYVYVLYVCMYVCMSLCRPNFKISINK